MKLVLETNDGKSIDTSSVKYMTMDGTEYALFPVIKNQPVIQNKFEVTEATSIGLDKFFGFHEQKKAHYVRTQKKNKRQKTNSIAYKVREWLDSGLNKGDTTNFASPSEYAIRVAAETQNKNISIRRIRKGLYNVIYNKPQVYARSKYRV